jgi:hypothetical protein
MHVLHEANCDCSKHMDQRVRKIELYHIKLHNFMKITFSSVSLRKIPVIFPVHPANNTTCQLNAMFFYDMVQSFLGILLFKLRRMTSQPLQLSAILFRHVVPPFCSCFRRKFRKCVRATIFLFQCVVKQCGLDEVLGLKVAILQCMFIYTYNLNTV